MKWLLRPVPVAVRSRIGRCLLYEVAVLARIAVLAVICNMKWLFWPLAVAVMSRVGRYLLSEVAALARIGGRYEPYWPLFAVWRGCSGPYRWPL